MKTAAERHGVGFERDWVTYYSQRPNVYPGKPPSAVLQITVSTCILALLYHEDEVTSSSS